MSQTRNAFDSGRPPPDPPHVLIAGAGSRLRRPLARRGHTVTTASLESALDRVDEQVEAIIIDARSQDALALCRRIKTRFQVPLLPVVILRPRPRGGSVPIAPDAWLRPTTRGREVAARIEELVRIRRAELQLARLNEALASLAAENGQLYERARRDASRTLSLLRELQHRVRNNLAAIQALLVLERHRTPRRSLDEAIDVAIARIRGMAALQDAVSTDAGAVALGALARAIARNAIDVFGPHAVPSCDVHGDAAVPAHIGSSLAVALNELVMNAVRHAEAHHVSVDIERADGEVKVEVSDDGRGLDAPDAGGGGLIIARTVIRNELRGSLDLLPRTSGTAVRITVPLPPHGKEERPATSGP